MISAHLFGGLGNQLFQFAVAYAEALRQGEPLIIPEPFRGETHDSFSQSAMREILARVGCGGDLAPGCRILPRGYYQDAKYFEGFERELLQSLTPIHPLIKINDAIAIHVRLGDYLQLPGMHPVISKEYIRASVELQLAAGASPAVHVFSDAPEMAINLVRSALSGLPIKIHSAARPDNSVLQLQTLAAYDHMICSNSTFSWWAAWLHRGVSSKASVTMPARWLGQDFKGDWQHIYRGKVCIIEA